MEKESLDGNFNFEQNISKKGMPQWSPYFVPNGKRIYSDEVAKEDRHSVGNFLLPASMREVKNEELTRGLDALKGTHTGIPLGWDHKTKNKGQDPSKGIPKWSPLYQGEGSPDTRTGANKKQLKARSTHSLSQPRMGARPRRSPSPSGQKNKSVASAWQDLPSSSSYQLPGIGRKTYPPRKSGMPSNDMLRESQRSIPSPSYRQMTPKPVKSAAYFKTVIPKSKSVESLHRAQLDDSGTMDYYGYKSRRQSLNQLTGGNLNPRERWDQRMKERHEAENLKTMRDMFAPLLNELKRTPEPEDKPEAEGLAPVFDESLFHAPTKRMTEFEKRDRGVGIPPWSPFKGDKNIDYNKVYTTSHRDHGSFLKAQTKMTPRTMYERTRNHITEMKETMTADHTWELIGSRPKYMPPS